MTEDEFRFKDGVDVNEVVIKPVGEALAANLGTDPTKMKCKGIRIFYVNEHGTLATQNFFIKGFCPEHWGDDY